MFALMVACTCAVLILAANGQNIDKADKGDKKVKKDKSDDTKKDKKDKKDDAKKALPLLRVVAGGKTYVNSIGMGFRLIDSGTFKMGSRTDEPDRISREFRHEVEITRPFYMGICEVTQQQYADVIGNCDSCYFTMQGGGRERVRGMETANFPVERVSWEEAMLFCSRLSEMEQAKKIVYDLPTEAEWEYACRAGTETPYHVGKTLTLSLANFRVKRPENADEEPVAPGHVPLAASAALERTCRVGSYAPNAWGLHDMHGNVAEWCKDWYDKDYYRNSPLKDPPGPLSGMTHVIRGGSWNDTDDLCRSAYHAEGPNGGRYYIGFRIVIRSMAGSEKKGLPENDMPQP